MSSAAIAVSSALAFSALFLVPGEARVPQESPTIEPRPRVERPWGIGFQVGWLGRPKGHLGPVALGGDSGYFVTPELVARRQLGNFEGINVGVGLPHAGMGLSGWAAFEIDGRVAACAHETLVFDLYVDPGVQLGYAGADYFARHRNDFVGYEYTAGGPLALALRFPAGARLRWAGGWLDSYVESAPIIALTPSVEPLFQVVFGTRVRF